MKQNFARTLSCMILIMSFVGVVPLFADENTVNLESAIVQDFSKPEAQNWFVLGSKFSTKPSGEAPFPRLSWANAWPQAGKTVYGSTSEKDIRALGVAMLFDRKEFNWGRCRSRHQDRRRWSHSHLEADRIASSRPDQGCRYLGVVGQL